MLRNKYCIIGLIILFIVFCLSQSTIIKSIENKVSSNYLFIGDILFVGGNGTGNYSKIQDAIDNATKNDIVYVFNESSPYFENIFINKSISIIGEEKESTIINGRNIGSVLTINENNVTIKGFTIERSGDNHFDRDSGIKIFSNGNRIIDNKIIINQFGIFLISSSKNTIMNNTINYNEYGICLFDSASNNIIYNNTLESWTFDYNIYIKKNCNNNNISNNYIINYDGHGVYVYESDLNTIIKNNIIDCEIGISLYHSNFTDIADNYFQNQEDGLFITRSTGNFVSNNIFVNDGIFVYDSFENDIKYNSVNGKVLVYLENISNKIITNNPGQVILINCENIIVENKEITNTNVAIELWNSNNCSISENSLSHNRRDIILYDSDFNKIKNNEIEVYDGFIFMNTLLLRYCRGNEIVGNKFSIYHEFSNIMIKESQENLISQNIITSNIQEIHMRLILSKADFNIIEKNTFNFAALSIQISDYNSIKKNTFNHGSLPISWSEGNIISGNQIYANIEGYCIPIEDSFNNKIYRNTIENYNGAFLLTGSLKNEIKNNNIINCGKLPAIFSNSLCNKWWRNYWGHKMLRPKYIPGVIRISRYYKPDIIIPVFNLDLIPRQFPYILT